MVQSEIHNSGSFILPNMSNVSQTNGSPNKLVRSFTLPRNPFGSVRVIKRKLNANNGQNEQNNTENTDNNKFDDNDRAGRKVFRRPSWKKFINKIAQHMNSVGVPRIKHNAMDRVPPLESYTWPPDQTPGVTGLRNHGNTCFMNAVIQCLSHTDILAEYFVLDQYKIDLSRRNKINSKKNGTKGELTEQLALMLKALWACKDSPELTTRFKTVVERHGSQFRGSAQHDAQEFLIWLLDKVHEDLNVATKRKYKVIKNSQGRPDEVVAAETLANHVRCNSSFVQAVFQAQFRSSLTCPKCHRQSNTFDPFQCISVQLPQIQLQHIVITVLYNSQQPRQVRLGVSIPLGSSIAALREILQEDTGIPISRLLLIEIGKQGFTRTFCDSQPASLLCVDDPIYCIEAPLLDSISDTTENSATSLQNNGVISINETDLLPSIDGGPYLLLCWVNILVHENGEEDKFGSPYVMQVPRDVGYCDLQKLILKEMALMVHDDVLERTQNLGVFRPRLADHFHDQDCPVYLDMEVEHPLFTETIDMCLSVYPPDAGPPHVKLQLEWSMKEYEEIIQHPGDVLEDHFSVSEVLSKSENANPLTLEQCLEHYTRAETLSDEDAWRCPHCQKYMPVVKTLGLWSLPDILVIHFKRFRQQQIKGNRSTKLSTMVYFPLCDFDMTPHLSRPENSTSKKNYSPHNGQSWSPWKRPLVENPVNENLYDLYAVCYHQGNDLETGHYTAACKNPFDLQWYMFDDVKVTKIENNVEDALLNNKAYILFYQRKQGSSEIPSASSSISGDHWVSRMAPFLKPMMNDSDKHVEEETNNSNLMPKSQSLVENIQEVVEDRVDIRNSLSLNDNYISDICCSESIENLSCSKSNEHVNKSMKSPDKQNEDKAKFNSENELEVVKNKNVIMIKADSNELRRNTFDCSMNKDIHINPKMCVGSSTDNSKLIMRSESKVNSITDAQVVELLSKCSAIQSVNKTMNIESLRDSMNIDRALHSSTRLQHIENEPQRALVN